jgi:ABC-type polysaccharide/polyol phosphate export permease
MLENLYNYFGFTGSLIVAFFAFIFFVFWIGGVAGICSVKRPLHRQLIFFSLAVLIPVYPVAWLIADMIKQKKQLRKLS